MESQNKTTAARIGAYTTLIGSLCMFIGTAFLEFSGAGIDGAIDANDLSSYLNKVSENRMLLIGNLSFWIVGVILIGAGATMMSALSTKHPIIAKIVQYNYGIAIPLVVASYAAWLSVVVQLPDGSSPTSIAIAEVVGWFASRADWIATILVLATGPFLISVAGRKDWMPNWLYIWSLICLFTGLLNAISLYAGGLPSYGFIIIPVGMGWLIASSVVLFKFKS
ncbi:MAG: hypothetical protein IPJ74_00750 [Saprospiraceae bacterium]|nr:hypothetical protein [Saprospiraceae bacterium]